MLDLLRGFSKGWVAKVLIALLIVSFGVWGISGSLFFGSQYNVVQVGDTKIDAAQYRFAYENQLLALSQSIGRRINRQEADTLGLRENVLTQVVAGAVLDENARKMGLGVSDENVAEEIAKDPNFRDLSGQFSRNALRSSLARAGISEADYIQNRKRVSLRNQILDGTAASLSMPEVYSDALAIYQDEKRVFEFVTVGREAAGDTPTPSESDLLSYYEANKTEFVAPEYRKVAILKLEPSDVMKPQEVTSEEVLQAYNARKSNLRTPERRQIQQLVLPSMEEAEKVKLQLSEGTSFEHIVAEQGKTVTDIDLGLLRRDELPDENISKAAFEAELNQPTEIIEGLFGPVIVRVAKIEEENTTPFEEIKDALREQIALERAVEDVFSTYDAVEEERGAGEQIVPTGEKLGLATRTISSMDARGLDKNGNPITNVPQFAEFVSEVNEASPGDDNLPIELGESGFLWYEVLEIIPERQKPFEEVSHEVKEAWISVETDKAVKGVALEIAKRLEASETFNLVLANILPTDSLGQAITASTSEPLSRSAQSAEFPSVAVRAGFAIKTGSIGTIAIGDNKEIVFKVAEVQNPGSTEIPEDLSERIDLAASQDILSQVVAHLQDREEVLVNRNAIELAFSPYGGNHSGY
ncbi:MAG: SurA N-terminal domain-containing protein [Rhizobiaceae bacterium]